MSAAVAPSALVPAPAADRPAPARSAVAEATAGRASREATRPQPSERPIASSRSPLQVCEAALRRERVKDALVACEQVATANPTSANAVVLLAHADLLAGRDGETLRLARRASTLDPKCAEAYLLIGNVEQAAGRKPDARIAYEAYLHAAPRGFHAAEVRAILRSL
jgi:Flp pilus assembly protein TadD